MDHEKKPTIYLTVFVVLVVATVGLFWTGESRGGSSVPASPHGKDGSLKMAYSKWFAIGAAIPGAELNEAERQLLFNNFSTVTPENCMKPEPLQPVEGRFDFAKGDALVEMARANGLTVNGHTLVWHQQCPDWFFTDDGKPADRDLVLKRMRSHIFAVVSHFASRVSSWDVVNEAMSDGDDYLRNSKWFSSIGEDFIAEAFAVAHLADPKAELYYNDYGIEYPDKRAKTLRLIRDLKARRAPIFGVGIQGHWQIDRIPFKDIEEAILTFHSEGMKVSITELDIDVVKRQFTSLEVGVGEQNALDPYASDLPADVQKRLANQYGQLFALFLKHADKIDRVTFWGLHDGRTWLNYWPSKRTNHPLLWDRALQAKPALWAVLALASPEIQRRKPVEGDNLLFEGVPGQEKGKEDAQPNFEGDWKPAP